LEKLTPDFGICYLEDLTLCVFEDENYCMAFGSKLFRGEFFKDKTTVKNLKPTVV